jgi:hypothetical protein
MVKICTLTYGVYMAIKLIAMGAILVQFGLDKKKEIENFYGTPQACSDCYNTAIAGPKIS